MSKAQGQSINLLVSNLDCPDCALSLEKAVQSLPGVASAKLIFASSRLIVVPEADEPIVPSIQKLGESMGYEVTEEHVAEHAAERAAEREAPESWIVRLKQQRRLLSTALGGLFLLAALILQLAGAPVLLAHILYGASSLAGGIYVARAGWVALRRTRSLDMNALMTVAVIGAMFVGEFAEGAVTVLLFSIGELLESYSLDRARNAIRELVKLAPAQATLLHEDHEDQVPVEALRVGDRIVVRPGERLPMDGRVIEGQSEVNQAPITGESALIAKGPQDEVYAGTLNGGGALILEVTRLAEDNTIARIMRLVEEAQAERAPSQRFVDRFAQVYTPIVMGLALLVAFVPPLVGLGTLAVWGYRALVLLVISCPCALVISTPVTIVSALARAARSGVLIKGGKYLEAMGGLKAIAFDKTGTLTRGEPYVVGGGCELHRSAELCVSCDDLLAKAAAIEARSEHALAKAILRHAQQKGLDARYAPGENVTALTGLGVEGMVEGHVVSVGSHAMCHRNGDMQETAMCEAVTQAESEGYTVLVIQDECCKERCYLTVADTLRDGVPEMVDDLRRAGIAHTVMLTGDNPYIADTIGAKATVDQVRASLLPEDKVRAVDELRQEHGNIAMVGDGVNDAPAMAKATVGIAMGVAGTGVALETADIALMSDDLGRLPFLIRLSRRALGIIRSNILFALIVKAAFLALAVGGVATLWMAVLADVGASLIVILNGLRMLRFRERA